MQEVVVCLVYLVYPAYLSLHRSRALAARTLDSGSHRAPAATGSGLSRVVRVHGPEVQLTAGSGGLKNGELLRPEIPTELPGLPAANQGQRITLAEHRPPRGEGPQRRDPHPEEQAILQAAPEITGYVTALQQKGRKVVALALRQLLRLLKEYPREPFLAAVREAAQYGPAAANRPFVRTDRGSIGLSLIVVGGLQHLVRRVLHQPIHEGTGRTSNLLQVAACQGFRVRAVFARNAGPLVFHGRTDQLIHSFRVLVGLR